MLDLRLLLERALKASKLTSHADKHLAVVLLDGACERAAGIAAKERSLKVEIEFEKTLNRVVQQFRTEGWTFQGVGSLLDLHRARNSAQHHGIRVNSGQFSSWCALGERFVRSLVNHLYGVDVYAIWRADAISDTSISGCFRQAEAALHAGDNQEAIHLARTAFEEATGHWKRQRRHLTRHIASFTPNSDREVLGPLWDDIEKRLADIDEHAALSLFVDDAGEALWVTSLLREADTPYTRDEAERMLDFIFWWIVRWEGFSQTLVVDREQQWLVSRRKVRQQEDVVAGIETIAVDGAWENSWKIELTLRDVPAEKDFNEWRSHAVYHLQHGENQDIGQHWRITEYGTLVFYSGATSQPKRVVDYVTSALRMAEASMSQARQRQEDEKREIENREQNLRSAMEQHMPERVTGISLERAVHYRKDVGCLLTVKPDTPGQLKVRERILQEPDVEQCSWASNGALGIYPAPAAKRLIEILRHVDSLVRKEASKNQSAMAQYQQKKEEMLRGLLDAVHDASGGIAGDL
ncbi:hypothetical protein ABGB17_17085 [Sphaerisporangium sp. B11E5]|uniref:hypothetical protein n=1 Tax=Sphaerisporangium sp. B11E5 TaxID=3153563 RepID=UPI00325EB3A9